MTSLFDARDTNQGNKKHKLTRCTYCDKDLFPGCRGCDSRDLNLPPVAKKIKKQEREEEGQDPQQEMKQLVVEQRGMSLSSIGKSWQWKSDREETSVHKSWQWKSNQGEEIYNDDYKSSIFPPYKEYMETERNDPTLNCYLLQPPPTRTQKKNVIVDSLHAARRSLLLEHVKAGRTYYIMDSRLDILDTCLILAHDYDLLGYKSFKRKWDDGTYYGKGNLYKSLNVGIDDFVGEVIEFVCPSRELERIIDPFTKAIAIVETWKTEEDFIRAWNDFFQGKPDRSDARFVYLGWQFEHYLGWDGRFVQHRNNVKQKFCQFSTLKLADFWKRACNTVKALLIMDCIDFWAYRKFRSSGLIDEPFDFSFD